ncbi:MAG TPA: hypothetical protein VHG27_02780 [Xanthobacteraceae bacterium]|nr:hypothetical protein [Xanthobacteraceae bacterium]
MPSWTDKIREEARAVASAPILSAIALALSLAIIWGIVHWSYGAALENRDNHIAQLERRVSEYRDKLNGATPDEAKKRIEGLETEITTLRVRLQPRRLTPVQRQAIIDRSRLPSGATPNALTVSHEEKCSDCAQFAADLIEALRTAEGFVLETGIVAGLSRRPRYGLAIRVPQPLRPPPEAVMLQQALRSAGVAFDVIAGATDPPLELLVTERIPQ